MQPYMYIKNCIYPICFMYGTLFSFGPLFDGQYAMEHFHVPVFVFTHAHYMTYKKDSIHQNMHTHTYAMKSWLRRCCVGQRLVVATPTSGVPTCQGSGKKRSMFFFSMASLEAVNIWRFFEVLVRNSRVKLMLDC